MTKPVSHAYLLEDLLGHHLVVPHLSLRLELLEQLSNLVVWELVSGQVQGILEVAIVDADLAIGTNLSGQE